jgi:Putative zinc-finger
VSTELSWHADDATIDAYLHGRLSFGPSSSVEAHLPACERCRARLTARLAPPATMAIDRAWSGLRDRVAVPPLPPVVRWMRRLGLGEDSAVLLAAARSMSTAWTLATIAVLAFAAASLPIGPAGQAAYLIIAPLVPVAGVVVSFGPAHDPFAELTRSTSYPISRLILIRSLGVAVTSVPLAVALGLAVPGTEWLAFVWLVPALAFILIVLTASTWIDPLIAGGVLALGWAFAVSAVGTGHSPAAAVSGPAQFVYMGLALAAAAVLTLRIRHSNPPGGIV